VADQSNRVSLRRLVTGICLEDGIQEQSGDRLVQPLGMCLQVIREHDHVLFTSGAGWQADKLPAGIKSFKYANDVGLTHFGIRAAHFMQIMTVNDVGFSCR